MESSRFNIKDALLPDIREFKAPALAQKIINSNQISELVLLAFEKDHLLSSRAMWVFGHCSDIDYNCTKPYHLKLINNLKQKNLHLKMTMNKHIKKFINQFKNKKGSR
jgi:hypothetical protein